jgi:predicted O-methyltransferase YrrM
VRALGRWRQDWHRWTLVRLIWGDPSIKRVVEVGVYWGLTAQVVLDNCEQVEHYWLVDFWGLYRKRALEAPPETMRIWRLECEKVYEACRRLMASYSAARILRMKSVEAAEQFEPETLDLVFIDADHSEEAVTADIEAWWPLVRPGGYLTGHDYALPPHHYLVKDVARVVHRFFPGRISILPGWVWMVKK